MMWSSTPHPNPAYYLYEVSGDEYFFSVSLYHEYSFARKIDEHYSQVGITNSSTQYKGYWNFSKLRDDAEYNFTLEKIGMKNRWSIEFEEESN